jgi:hypothetical protein
MTCPFVEMTILCYVGASGSFTNCFGFEFLLPMTIKESQREYVPKEALEQVL